MDFTHDEMMLIIQGLRVVNGIDRFGFDYVPTLEQRIEAMNLLLKIDNES